MNRKVFTSMLALCVSFLVALYVLKIFFPQEFVMQITNERFVALGGFVDGNLWLKLLFTFLNSILTYYLYLGAVCSKTKFNIKEILIVFSVIAGAIVIENFFMNFLTHYSVMALFGLPLLFKARFDRTFIVFSIHGASQVLSLSIRGLSEHIYAFNFAIGFLLTLECYFWLLLFYIIFNFYQEKEI